MSEETVNEVEETVEETEIVEETATKRPKKLNKEVDYDNSVVTIEAIGGEKGVMTFAVADLPEEVQLKLIPFGLSHKLGDAAAGRTGKDAEEAITKVFEGLLKGDWSVRAPAAQKVSVSDMKSKLENMDPEQAEAARALMAQLGVKL